MDRSRRFAAAHDLLEAATRTSVAPAAVAEVGCSNGPLWQHAVGTLTYDPGSPPATHQTVFDLGSLTKVIATTTIAMRLVEAGRLALDAPVGQFIAGWRGADRSGVTVEDLLAHASGLPAVLPLYEHCVGRTDFEAAICRMPLEYAPRTRSIYSDLAFILLGFVLADVAGAPLEEQFEKVADNLISSESDVLGYGPITIEGGAGDRVAPTQIDQWRGRLLRGEVDDRNGAALGGVAGHAGLFGTITTVGRFAREVLRGRLGLAHEGFAPARPATIARFVARTSVPGSSRALGWDTMLPTSSCGSHMSAEAFGHTGFTGTSIWIDPAEDTYAVLLTNRVHPRAGSPEPIRILRRAFHDAILAGR